VKIAVDWRLSSPLIQIGNDHIVDWENGNQPLQA
jgi:hypothetical protein